MANQRFSAIIIITILAIAVSAVVFSSGILFDSTTINNQGELYAVGVGVYWEPSCVDEVNSVNWGYLEPGTSANVTIYILNDGNVPMTLNMTTSNWDPSSASSNITLSWNCEGERVNAGDVVEAELRLAVIPGTNGISSFSFDITITGTN